MRRRLTRSLTALFLLLLSSSLLPLAHAATLASGTAAMVTGESLSVGGPLRGIRIMDACDGVVVGTADRIQGEVDRIEAFPVVAGVAPAPSNRTVTEVSASNVSVEVDANDRCSVFLLPGLGGASLTSVAASVSSSAETPFVHTPRAVSRDPVTLDPTGSLGVKPARTVIVGDVRLVAWEARLTVVAGNEKSTFETGSRDEASAPGAPVTRRIEEEAFIELKGAHLTVSGAVQAFANSGIVSSPDHPVALQGGRLLLAGREIVGDEIVLQPPSELVVTPLAERVGVQLEEAAGVEVDGNAVSFPEDDSSPRFLWIWLAILVPLAATAEYPRRRGRLAKLMAQQQYEAAARTAHSIAWLPRLGRNARVAEVVALLRSHRLADAEAELGRQRRWRRMEATWQFLRAHLFAEKGDRGAARDSLAACLALNPGYAADARANAALREVISEALELAKARRSSAVEGYA